jgi:hypothetical protein
MVVIYMAIWLLNAAAVSWIAYLITRAMKPHRPSVALIEFAIWWTTIITFEIMALGLAGVLRPWSLGLVSLLLILGAVLAPGPRRALFGLPEDATAGWSILNSWWNGLPRFVRWLAAGFSMIGVLRFGFLIWALPPFVWDSLTYHLTNVAHWVQTGRIEIFTTSMERIFTPANYEALAAWFTVFVHHDALIEAAGLPAYLLAMVACYLIPRSLGATSSSSLVASLCYGATPALLIATTGTKNDPHMAAYILAILALLLEWIRMAKAKTVGIGPSISLVALTLLAFGTKAYLLPVLPGLVLAAVIAGAQQRRLGAVVENARGVVGGLVQARWPAQVGAVVLVAMALFVGTYWNLRNWAITGNPLYPYAVTIEGERLLDGPQTTNAASVGRAIENYQSLFDKFGDWQDPIRPDLPNVTGWGWFAYGLGIPALLWALIRDRRIWGPFLGLIASLTLIFLATRPTPWNMRYILWFPALFAIAYAFWLDRLRHLSGSRRLIFPVLATITIALNYAGALNYNRISPDQFAWMLSIPASEREAGVLKLNMPAEYENALVYVPNDAILGYNTHANGFIYPLYRADFSQRLVYLPFEASDSCELIKARMVERSARYLFVAPEHSSDLNIARLGECAAEGDVIQERARGLYVLAD